MDYKLVWLDPEEEKTGDAFDDGGWFWKDTDYDALWSGPFDTDEEAHEWLSKIL